MGFQQGLVQLLLPGQRAFALDRTLSFEGLQFRRDVAFGAFQCLPARVIVRRAFGLRLADFDVIAVDPVVAHLQ